MTAEAPPVNTGPATADPYGRHVQASGWRYLHHLNPLAKLAAIIPAMVCLIFVRDLTTPLAFLGLCYALILTGARFTRTVALLLFVGIPVAVIAIGFGFSVWVDASGVDHTGPLLQLGGWTLYTGAVQIGFATSLRLGAILALGLIPGLTMTGPDLVRASVQQLKVPYRIGYTAVAAYRFVPRFGYELSVIRAAHRVRGHHAGRGPLARFARGWGYIVPLLAGAIRHAERVALAMDSRAFGAYATRTERYRVPFRARDAVFIVLMFVASAAILIALFPWSAPV